MTGFILCKITWGVVSRKGLTIQSVRFVVMDRPQSQGVCADTGVIGVSVSTFSRS